MKARKRIVIFCICMTVLSLTACAVPDFLRPQESRQNGEGREDAEQKPGESTEKKQEAVGPVLPGPGSYDSADTAVLVNKNKDDNTVTLLNPELGKKYTLKVEGTSTLYDKYGEAVSLDQMAPGDIVDVTFLRAWKRLNSMQLSPGAWTYENVNRYEINTARNDMTIGQDTYKLNASTLFLSGGRPIEMMDLNAADVITVKGIDTSVLSVNVEKGHGYLRLANDENFIGGWIEIGQTQIRQITEDMLLTVPEGSHQVLISHSGGGGVKDIIINRNEELTLDIGDLEVAEVKTGMVVFSLSPTNTTLYIDGELVDASQPVTLDYGIHQMIAKADGYKSITTYLKVGQASTGINVTLDAIEREEDEDEDEDEEDSSTVSSYYKVYVDAPEGAEVYLDGSYMGISPCSFRKESGSHIITLRKTGYETRSYTIQVDKEEKDISYSFADLAAVSGETESTGE